jgi:hypothetical protein
MMKKMKKTLVVALAVAMITIPSLSFADAPKVIEKLDLRHETAAQNLETKAADAIAKRDAYRAKMTETINTYAPALLGDFESFWSEHDSLHIALIAERTRIMEKHYTESKVFYEGIKASVEADEMTREEAKSAILAFRAQVKLERETTKSDIDALKATYDLAEGEKIALNKALKEAVLAEDPAAVEAALTAIIAAQPKHLSFDQAKLDYLKTK